MVLIETWFKRFLWGAALLALTKSILVGSDLLLHPFAESMGNNTGYTGLLRYLFPLGGLFTLTVGILVLHRTRGNVVGILLIIWAGYCISIGLSKDAPVWVALLSAFPFAIEWTAIFLLIAYYPDGQPVPRAMGVFYALFLTILPVLVGLLAIIKMPTLPLTGLPANPLWIAGMDSVYTIVWRLNLVLSLPVFPIILIAPFLRYRHADYQQRQQLKFLGWLSLILIAPYAVVYLLYAFLYPNPSDAPENLLIIMRLFQLAISVFPAIVVSNAILRHRLYDIDIIIRRTLIYSILSAILAGVYLGTVILVQQLFQSATGDVPDFAIVLSTLLIAGLFTPVRRRVQDVIDRRFYRRKYNVEQTLAQFSQTLRDEVDIEVLKGQLVSVVQDTMQPSSIRLWVKENTPKR